MSDPCGLCKHFAARPWPGRPSHTSFLHIDGQTLIPTVFHSMSCILMRKAGFVCYMATHSPSGQQPLPQSSRTGEYPIRYKGYSASSAHHVHCCLRQVDKVYRFSFSCGPGMPQPTCIRSTLSLDPLDCSPSMCSMLLRPSAAESRDCHAFDAACSAHTTSSEVHLIN